MSDKQLILIGARNKECAENIRRRANVRVRDSKYACKFEHFQGIRNAILLLDGSGDYSFWYNNVSSQDIDRWELAGNLTVIIIPDN